MRALLRSASGRHTATAAITDPERAATGMATLSTMFEPASLKRVKNFLVGGCTRSPDGRSSRARGAGVRAAPPLRKGLVRPQRTSERRVPPPFHFQYIAHWGAC